MTECGPVGGRGRGRNPGIGIVFWEGWIGASPSIVNGIRMLEEAGWVVRLFTRETSGGFPPVPSFGPHTTIEICTPLSLKWERRGWPGQPPSFEKDPYVGNSPTGVLSQLKRAVIRTWGTFLLAADMVQFHSFVRRWTRGRPFEWWIGIDLLGLLVAARRRRAERNRLAYWSLEIIFQRNLRDPLQRLLKSTEKKASRRAELVIVQDAGRGEILSTENGIDPDRFVLVPNAPRGRPAVEKTTFLHDRLRIDRKKKIVLHLGMIGPEVLSTEIAAAARTWPEDFVLVFHERHARDINDPVVREVSAAGGEGVRFSLDPVDLDDLPNLVASADVGLVFYNPEMGSNYSVITGASGKLAFYVQSGLPVICLDLPGFPELVESTGCGLTVASLDEIGAALGRVLADYRAYRQGAVRCFEERFDFERQFAEVIRSMGSEQ
jgi:glycosyltransferase involved in cell wall biosynthesis